MAMNEMHLDMQPLSVQGVNDKHTAVLVGLDYY